jgi:hypothetical protein
VHFFSDVHFSPDTHHSFSAFSNTSPQVLLPVIMIASHPNMFQQSAPDESEILKLVENHFLPNCAVLQWRPAKGEDILTPNTKEIVVFSSYFQHEFGLPAYDFFQGLLQHYQIELVHLNLNSILQIVVFVHLYKAFLGIPTSFPLFKNYFFLKYQPSASN